MADSPNRALRLIVLLLVVLVGAVVFVAAINKKPAGTTTTSSPSPSTGATPSAGSPVVPGAAGAAPGAPVAGPAAAQPVPTLGKLVAKELTDGKVAFAALGSLDGPDATIRAVFSPRGAGLAQADLAGSFMSIKRDQHVTAQIETGLANGRTFTPLGLLGVEINGSYVDLLSEKVWRERATGSFEAMISDESGKEVARVERQFSIPAGESTIALSQRVVNLTTGRMTVRWFQIGAVEMFRDRVSYGGDLRKFRYGYLPDAATDPSRRMVLSSESAFVQNHDQVKGSVNAATNAYDFSLQIWPTQRSSERGYELSWIGTTNRYFAALVGPAAGRSFSGVATAERLFGVKPQSPGQPLHEVEVLATRLNSVVMEASVDGAAEFPMICYLGPQSVSEIHKSKLATGAGMSQVVLFNFGGPCGCCTFSWLTEPILGLLQTLHDHVTHDWSLAIIILVLIVKTLLHPITRWSQIRMQRFGKQMSAMGPKMQQLKEKYADDSAKLQAETAKLWREEGVNPAGMLGCLPMFLQTPVWMALSATLFFAAELRHQPAFYGVFQSAIPDTTGFWYFFGDLAEPDRLWNFGRTLFTVPMMGEISSINVMPFMLGVLFFVQQKYLSPPPSATMTPEQELQMKMMKWMTVVMFPLMMYNAPCGLTLYFFMNSTLSILEGKWVKRYMDKHDLLNVDKMREERAKKPPGFLARIQKAAEARQKQMEQARNRMK